MLHQAHNRRLLCDEDSGQLLPRSDFCPSADDIPQSAFWQPALNPAANLRRENCPHTAKTIKLRSSATTLVRMPGCSLTTRSSAREIASWRRCRAARKNTHEQVTTVVRRSLARSKEAATISASRASPAARSTTNGRQVPTDQSDTSATGIPSCRLRGRFAKRVPVDRPGGWVKSWTHAPSREDRPRLPTPRAPCWYRDGRRSTAGTLLAKGRDRDTSRAVFGRTGESLGLFPLEGIRKE